MRTPRLQHEPLEQFIAGVSPVGSSVEIPLDLLGDAPVEFKSTRADTPPEPSAVQLMALPAFSDQWAMMHDMAGGMVQMRTNAPCPLGEQARSEGGRVACEAAYNLISSSPALARMLLSPESTFFGQLAAVGMHGFACIQVVKISVSGHTFEDEARANG